MRTNKIITVVGVVILFWISLLLFNQTTSVARERRLLPAVLFDGDSIFLGERIIKYKELLNLQENAYDELPTIENVLFPAKRIQLGPYEGKKQYSKINYSVFLTSDTENCGYKGMLKAMTLVRENYEVDGANMTDSLRNQLLSQIQYDSLELCGVIDVLVEHYGKDYQLFIDDEMEGIEKWLQEQYSKQQLQLTWPSRITMMWNAGGISSAQIAFTTPQFTRCLLSLPRKPVSRASNVEPNRMKFRSFYDVTFGVHHEKSYSIEGYYKKYNGSNVWYKRH